MLAVFTYVRHVRGSSQTLQRKLRQLTVVSSNVLQGAELGSRRGVHGLSPARSQCCHLTGEGGSSWVVIRQSEQPVWQQTVRSRALEEVRRREIDAFFFSRYF